MRISDWSSDVCSSDLHDHVVEREVLDLLRQRRHEVLERTGIVVEIDEDEAAPHVSTDLRQRLVHLVETGEVVCLRNGLEFALRRVAPGVIGPYDAARCTAGLCDQPRATLLANIPESANFVVRSPPG